VAEHVSLASASYDGDVVVLVVVVACGTAAVVVVVVLAGESPWTVVVGGDGDDVVVGLSAGAGGAPGRRLRLRASTPSRLLSSYTDTVIGDPSGPGSIHSAQKPHVGRNLETNPA
jgi:hypothetical protein